ncbi:MAG: FGGY family carbohydrate kinase [Chitinophagaceae bacterium]
MYLLGIDLGTSFIKATLVDATTKKPIISLTYPEQEIPIDAAQPDWAEQDPNLWWSNVQAVILKLKQSHGQLFPAIAAIGIAYQMHGLVCVDKHKNVLRESIIWCDSRAVAIGKQAFETIGKEKCLAHLLNSPGNFTASKLKWVKDNEPETYNRIDKIMLPGDFIAMKLTGETNTSISALSEGVFWDFKERKVSDDVLNYYGFDKKIIPDIQNVFENHGTVTDDIAEKLGLPKGIPVAYKAGDQPNNALSLHALKPGEVAATAGTSGVVYAVTDQLLYDRESRINGFAHVNHTNEQPRIGVLLNINGVGIANSWMRKIAANGLGYHAMNEKAAQVKPGSDGLQVLPFGNGAERMLGNRIIQAHIDNIQFNIHGDAHLYRAVQEGIAFAFRYGVDIIRENGLDLSVIRVAHANMFLSPVFAQTFVNTLSVPIELYPVDGSVGAALGAGIGAGVFANEDEAFADTKPIKRIVPETTDLYETLYQSWKELLNKHII